MIRYRAAWIVPIATSPIRDGSVVVDGGRIVAIGRDPVADGARDVDLGAVALMPGLVNAHTHLELSYLHNHIPPAAEFTDWIRAVVAARRTEPNPFSERIVQSIESGIDHAVACGTALVGDISNTLSTVAPLRRSRLGGVVFYELIRFRAGDPEEVVGGACGQIEALPDHDRVRVGLAAHAPYSVARRVFQAIRQASESRLMMPYSVHLAESRAETEFVGRGTGPWRKFLEDIGAWDPDWMVPGGSPVDYVDDAGFLGPDVLAVHGVQMGAGDLTIVKASGATLVTCPRSNALTGAGTPPIEAFYASGARVAIGTDSLASTPDLNVFSEMAEMRRLAPTLSARAILESATLQGARALHAEADFGTLEPGKSGRLLAASLAGSPTDVEEYLVSGIEPYQLRWIETPSL